MIAKSKVFKLGLIIKVASFSFQATIQANGLRVVSQDAFAAARGEAFVATADNPSAIHYNPAGLTQLDGHNFRAGTYGLYLDPTFQPPAGSPNEGQTFRIERNETVIPQLYYSYSLDDIPLSVGLGVYVPYGAEVAWPQDTGFRAVAISGELAYLRFNPVIAYEVTSNFSIAGGLMLDYGDISLTQGLDNFNFPDSPEFNNLFAFSGDDWGLAYNIGALWKPHEKLSIGATFRSSTTLNFEGETEIFDPIPTAAPGFANPVFTPASLEYELPSTVAFGISYRPTRKWNIEFNADFTNWSSLDSTAIRQAVEPAPIAQDVDVNLGFRDSWIYKVGITRYFENGWRASAGYVFNENSVSDTFNSPLVADLDRHFFTFGLGYEDQRCSLDVSYQFGFSPSRTVSGSLPSALPTANLGIQGADGTFDFTSHALLISTGIKF